MSEIGDRISGIYCIENIRTKECYIGKSWDIENRLKDHKYLLEKKKHFNYKFQDAYNEFGPENFHAFVLVKLPLWIFMKRGWWHEKNEIAGFLRRGRKLYNLDLPWEFSTKKSKHLKEK